MEWHELFVAAFAAIATTPLAFFFPECPCCGESCGVADDKPRTDPANEGTWVPSGTWRGAGGVTWTFVANPGDDSGETWFFYGSASTSKAGGGASTTEQRDWGNICNWYSNKTTTPSSTSSLPSVFDKRATRLPPENAVVHVYSPVSTSNVGPQVVKQIYFWRAATAGGVHTGASSSITATGFAHDSNSGAVFNGTSENTQSAVINGGAVFNGTSENSDFAVINGGAIFNSQAHNVDGGVVSGGAVFNDLAFLSLSAVVNDGAVFNDNSTTASSAIVNGGAVFNGSSEHTQSAVINGGAVFNDSAISTSSAVVNGGAVLNDVASLVLSAVVNDGAVFNNSSANAAIVNDGAIFNDNSVNDPNGTVNGGATFNGAACSQRTTGNFFATPCTRKFVAHPTDLPTCNGTAPDGCANSADTCGCG